MEEIYLQVADRLHGQVPALDHIDEDTGQLYPEQYDDRYEYPILFPCALIDAATADWKNGGQLSAQRGTMTVTVKLAFRCDEDSHFSSIEHGNGFGQLRQRQGIRKKVVRALNGWCPDEDTPMQRIQSRSYSLQGRVRVYEETFKVNVTEELEVGE